MLTFGLKKSFIPDSEQFNVSSFFFFDFAKHVFELLGLK